MFIFHLIGSIILLPFIFIRMLFGLLGISFHIFLIPLKIFARHPILCSFIIICTLIYFAVKKDPHALDSLKPAAPQDRQAAAPPKGAVPIIEPVTKREDGDSAFATDTYTNMTDIERQQYSQHYYTAMSTTPDGEVYNWAYYNVQGALRPTRTFTNNSGETCRTFTEVLKVHRVQQTISGTACVNGPGAWCKLKPNATPSCGLGGNSPGMFDSLIGSVRNLF